MSVEQYPSREYFEKGGRHRLINDGISPASILLWDTLFRRQNIITLRWPCLPHFLRIRSLRCPASYRRLIHPQVSELRHSKTIGDALRSPSGPNNAAFTKSVSSVLTNPCAPWMCPKTCSFGFTRATASKSCGQPAWCEVPGAWSRMPKGGLWVMRISTSSGIFEYNLSRSADELRPKVPP